MEDLVDIVNEGDLVMTRSNAHSGENSGRATSPTFLEELAQDLATSGRLARVYENVTVYLSEACGWCLLDSALSMAILCQMASISAPVNYETATVPLRTLIKELELPDYIMGTTVCFKKRYDVIETEEAFLLQEVNMVLTPNATSRIDRSLCMAGIKVSHYCSNMLKSSLAYYKNNKLSIWLQRTFGDSLVTLMWLIGNCIVEPASNNYLTILVGESMSGKSTAINVIADIFEERASVLPSSVIVSSEQITSTQIIYCAGSRVILSQDLEFHPYHGINVANMKIITGGDPIAGSSGQLIRMSKTLIATANYLPTMSSNSAWCRPEHSRRFLAIRTRNRLSDSVSRENLPLPFIDKEERSKFVSHCILRRLCRSHIPLSMSNLFLVLFLGNGTHLMSLFETTEKDDPAVSYGATIVLARLAEVSLEMMMTSIIAISPSFVHLVNGSRYIRKLKFIADLNVDGCPHLIDKADTMVNWNNSPKVQSDFSQNTQK